MTLRRTLTPDATVPSTTGAQCDRRYSEPSGLVRRPVRAIRLGSTSGPGRLAGLHSSEIATVANRPKLTVTFTPPCQSDADCNDNVACTADSCNTGTGECSNTSTCTGGQLCNTGNGLCGFQITFQDGVGGFSGTQDAEIQQANPAINLRWDRRLAVGLRDGDRWFLDRASAWFALMAFRLRSAGQIPQGSTIQSATLTLVSFNATVAQGNVNEVAVDWQESAVRWETFGDDAGVQDDEYRPHPPIRPAVHRGRRESADVTVTASVDVTPSLQAWSTNPAVNLGWIFRPNSTDGCRVYSAEQTTVAQRPLLDRMVRCPPFPPAPSTSSAATASSATARRRAPRDLCSRHGPRLHRWVLLHDR